MKYIAAGHSSDKGHNYDSGAVGKFNGKKITEAEMTKRLRDLVCEELKTRGFTDFKTDKDDWNYGQTIANAGTTEKDVLLDIHFNAGHESATGVECFVATQHTPLEKKYAQELCNSLSEIMLIPNRGVKREDQCRHGRLGIMRPNGLNLLLEVCFITNEGKDLTSYYKNEARIVDAIADILIKADNELK